MTPHTELELKYLLDSEKDLANLAKALGDKEIGTLWQVNHFFLPKDGRPRSYIVRLRQENGRFILTAKSGGKVIGALAERLEAETEIDRETGSAILHGQKSPLAVLRQKIPELATPAWAKIVGDDYQSADFYHAGSFTNRRNIWEKSVTLTAGANLNLRLEYDCVTFPGDNLAFELEIEIPALYKEELSAYFAAKLDELGFPVKTAPGKASRFFKYAALFAHSS